MNSIETIINGEVDFKRLETLRATQVRYAIGAGLFLRKQALCEMVIFNHQIHLGLPNQIFRNDKSVLTPFWVGVESKPSIFKTFSKQSLEKILDQLLTEFPQGFKYIAQAHFTTLEGCWLIKNPSNKESFLDHIDAYIQKVSYGNTFSKLVGIVSNKADKTIYYVHPKEKRAFGFYSHTHGITNKTCLHVLNQSYLFSGDFWIEPLGN